ncbi:MAG: hypothetical protein U0894_18985 [Pirellulales bacterium]
MNFKRILRNTPWSGDVKSFKKYIVKEFNKGRGKRTIDDVLCDPVSAKAFCEAVRESLGSSDFFDGLILAALLNVRKNPSLKTQSDAKKKRPATLQAKLKQCGLSVADQKDLGAKITGSLREIFKGYTIDNILCYPDEALALCRDIKADDPYKGVSDELILRKLLSIRKAGKL